MTKLQKMLFGASSEKRKGDDKEEKKSGNDDEQKQTGHGPREQPELPHVDVHHELDEEAKVCDQCGGRLDEWDGQEETSEEVSVVERVFIIKKYKQKKYRCKCGACIKTAPKPPRVVEGAPPANPSWPEGFVPRPASPGRPWMTPETKPHRLKIRFNRELHRQTPVQTGFKRELQ